MAPSKCPLKWLIKSLSHKKKTMSRSFLNSGTLIVISVLSALSAPKLILNLTSERSHRGMQFIHRRTSLMWPVKFKWFEIPTPSQKTTRSRYKSINWSQASYKKGCGHSRSFSVGNTTSKSQHLCRKHHREERIQPWWSRANSKWLLNMFLPNSHAAIVCTFQHPQYRQRSQYLLRNKRNRFHNYVNIKHNLLLHFSSMLHVHYFNIYIMTVYVINIFT